ncbi:MAG: UDP-N-acetylmuramate dehydrogenase [Candidatus Absconditabacterales bacterium]|nr:UDP-N-acetylmuramate dehydrogenase [Candidatus Absconditabacterales bacterium]
MVDIGHLTTFATLSQGLSVTTISSPAACKHIQWTSQHTILGGGSNTVFATQTNRHIIKAAIMGREATVIDAMRVRVTLGSGESWMDAVEWSMNQGRGGRQNLIDIPGTVGGAVVQNIGAYGVEICQTIVSIVVYDFLTHETFVLDNAQCQFGYRHSVFKTPRAQSWFIISATFDLTTTNHHLITTYAGLDETLDTPIKICDRVRSLRKTKLPDWRIIPTAGSFFANPVVDENEKNRLLCLDPHLVVYPFGSQRKVSAGYLIEKTVGKGWRLGKVGTYEKHALIMVADGHVPGSAVHDAAFTLIGLVREQWGLTLVPEVLMVT